MGEIRDQVIERAFESLYGTRPEEDAILTAAAMSDPDNPPLESLDGFVSAATLRNERDEAIAEMIEWRKACQSWTPGGSEFMTPAAVLDFVRERRNAAHTTMRDKVLLKREVGAVRSCLQEACNLVSDMYRNGNAHDETVEQPSYGSYFISSGLLPSWVATLKTNGDGG